jgi:hypothetical protein
MNTKNLFMLSFIAILTTYYFILGIDKSIQLIKDEYLSILALIIILLSLLFFKLKLKGHQTINFIRNNQFSLKSTILFFLVFQVVDYYYENGFIGMISQWFLYWIMGLIAITLMETINCYKNYKYLKNKP